MPVTDSFLAFVLEQLDAVGPMTAKRMFGGVGLYAGDLFDYRKH
jgi:DNA transformation protein